MSASIKILIVEEQDLLREKIAGILSREENITMVIQIASYSKLRGALEETIPDILLADFFEFNKFCKENGIFAGDLCPDANTLLYTDENWRLNPLETGHLGEQRIFDVRLIQQEVKSYLQAMSPRKHTINNKIKISK
ncbi:MAG: hypothetical protein WCX65_05965 [bacterium]